MLVPPGYGAVTRPIALRLAPALAVLATTLLAGMTGPSRPGAWQMLDSAAAMAVTGLLLAGAAGLLACHLAQLTARPFPSLSASALPAALIAGAVPGLGMAALFVPLVLCGHAATRSRFRPAALFGLFGATAGIGSIWIDSPALGTSASLAMLAAASLLLRDAGRAAINDNRPVERFGAFWIPPDNDRHATRASSPGLGE
ncbi:hypothetical protein [Sphingomonas sp. Root241]|uniref:hypothetical protein n=1 Tax=Sphingomonas sp. Root241 TaxID=1736501 RepID=UPI0006FEBC98|nr:hypothetical protein [Sphingomonas sp. Root241]KRC81536.1 hypothetical protein ASE13_03895 [Sphingomonas sp. Root241]